MRIVATLTTMPGRYDILRKTLDSLHQQTMKFDAIYLTLPKINKRFNIVYPPLPEDIAALCTVIPSEIDYGPLTKIYGGITQESDPETVILSVDDDVIYPPDLLEVLIRHQKDYPNSAICGTGSLLGRGLILMSIVTSLKTFAYLNGFIGFQVGKEGRKVDLVYGIGGVLYKRRFFKSNKEEVEDFENLYQYALYDHSLFVNDDIVISGYLSLMEIERRLFIDIPRVIMSPDPSHQGLSADVINMVRKFNTSISKSKEAGLYPTTEELNTEDTMAYHMGAIIILIIVLILTILMCYFNYHA